MLGSGSGESIESQSLVKFKGSFNRQAAKLGLKEATSVAHKSVNGVSAEASGSSAQPLSLSAGELCTYADVCSRMLTYAHVCSRMLTYLCPALEPVGW